MIIKWWWLVMIIVLVIIMFVRLVKVIWLERMMIMIKIVEISHYISNTNHIHVKWKTLELIAAVMNRSSLINK